MVQWGRMIPAYGTMQIFRSGGGSRETDEMGVIDAATDLHYPVACIWEPHDSNIGHASIFIQKPEGAFPDEDRSCYASLWPKEAVSARELLPGGKVGGLAFTFKSDCKNESKQTDGYRLPDHMIPMGGLDKMRMQAAWNAIRDKPDIHYRLLRKNCATIAARVIKAGMARQQLAMSPLLTHKAWWTPNDVLMLARACPKSDGERRMDELLIALKL
jgi:hypothetical protein